ncbi:putative thiazole-containing bacteriocin maturation protein [Neobacillus niacini]|uniref:putative thiazole-containing bacteriocin maturation protein n=1 Tax=Neobacillus niacini TaxID=86668 RepID=UPI00052F906C|nr:putative thiazole-containing bacteriocin maturation protein [Neobacillus niacini]KGM44764.1 bacteriocin maturation protein [Neobacillus niacini]MEC1525477.1 putative thiazole-containing bacteriocin maturation protein [Neobacillus niacini]
MTNMNPSMRLKVNRDTFFLPDPNRGVYFRNNVSSFRMEGSMIDQWVEKLIPMFNGEHTLENLTTGLQGPYRNRVYEIAEALYRNGFVRDVSQDRSHQLKEQVLKKYASQIEFVDNLIGSGAFHFQSYRQAKVLAVGSGPFFVSLVSSLLDSGLAKFHILIKDSVQTNRRRLMDLVEHVRKTDGEVEIEEVLRNNQSTWQEMIKPFDYILYVAQKDDVEELRLLHRVSKEEKKVFLPAICLEQAGLAGPLVHPDSEGCWESAWRRIHQSALYKDQPSSEFSSTAGAMLANVIVFELFKNITGVSEKEPKNKVFLQDFETLEGDWHTFMPHPLVTGQPSSRMVEDLEMRLAKGTDRGDPGKLLLAFNQMTSKVSGIFHTWEEGDLSQLPLSQCRVQAVNPLAEGPSELLDDIVCTGLTHEEARREAGLSGIESYVSQMVGSLELPPEVVVGAGETFAEGVCRGLQRYLDEELIIQSLAQNYSILPVQLSTVKDERCQFYLKALSTLRGAPTIGIGEEVSGFPVVWIGTNDGWYGSADLNITLALRNALQQAISTVQNKEEYLLARSLEVSSMILDENVPKSIEIPGCEERIQTEDLLNAMEILKRNGKQLSIYELELEPFLKEGLAGIFGVLVQEEGLT